MNKLRGATLKNLQFPSHRIVDDATSPDHLGKMSAELWDIVEHDIHQAIQENSEAYDDCERKIYDSK